MTTDTVVNLDLLDDVRAGLSQSQKSLPCIWFYDDRGSELFQQITHLSEYYLTRTEQSILEQRVDGLAQRLGAGTAVVEYGAQHLHDSAHQSGDNQLDHNEVSNVEQCFLE